MKKFIAECLGTATLVFLGCGSLTLGAFGPVLGASETYSTLAVFPIACAFGLTVLALAYAIGPISGCHVNPAVSVGVWSAGRLSTQDLALYIVAQFIGALIGAGLLLLTLKGRVGGYDVAAGGLGQNGWSNYEIGGAFLAELIGTFLFLVVILGATSKGAASQFGGLAIGLSLVVIHIVLIRVTGTSVNPARSFGPAIFVGGKALEQLWLFLLAPTLGGFLAGLLYRFKVLED